MSFAKQTSHPNIFTTSHWGRIEGILDTKLVTNRNTFVDCENIKECIIVNIPSFISTYEWRYDSSYNYAEVDNVEFYKTHTDDWILLNSPLKSKIGGEEDEVLKHIGWKKYDELYSPDRLTYILRIPGYTINSFKPLAMKYIRQFLKLEENTHDEVYEFGEGDWNYYLYKSVVRNDIYIKRFKKNKHTSHSLSIESAYVQNSNGDILDETLFDNIEIVKYKTSGCRTVKLKFD
jgi:hypothetical protein